MPIRRYEELYNMDIRRPERPMEKSVRPLGFGDYLAKGAEVALDGFSEYEKRKAAQIKAEYENDRIEREKAADAGRAKFRQSLIDGKDTPVLREPNQLKPGEAGPEQNPDAYSPRPYTNPLQTGSKKEPLDEKEMVDSYLKNVPMSDDTDARGVMSLLIDKNKPAGLKMKEVTDAYDADLLKRIELYKQQNNGAYPTKDWQEQQALEIGGSNYAKLIKQSSSKETSFDQHKQSENEKQRGIGNALAGERLSLARQNFELAAGKDLRTDTQEYGKKVTDLQAVETHLAPIERKLKEGAGSYLSSKVFSNNWAQIAQNLEAEDPELSAELGFLGAAYIKMISGAAVTEAEAVRLLGSVGVSPWSS